MDQIYRNLLLHLQTSQSATLHKGIPPTLAHYLAILPVPLPTTLTASAIASPAWAPSNVSLLLLAFRQAVNRKAESLLTVSTTTAGDGPSTTGSSSLFSLSPGPAWNFRKWIRALCSGARSGRAFVRVAALGGVLLGLEDVKDRLDAGGARPKVEGEVVVALAEYLEGLDDSWAMEVGGQARIYKEEMLYIASYVLPLVSEKKFKVLDLPNIITRCTSSMQAVFEDTGFLQSQTRPDETYKEALNNRLPHIARLASRAIQVLSDNPNSTKLILLHEKLVEVIGAFHKVSGQTENFWVENGLHAMDGDTGSNTDKITWTHLKALLFTAVMILQSTVDSVLYNTLPANSNSSLASFILEIFSRVSFISTKFGGVVARGEGSFREYQRAFYTALDIVAASPSAGEDLVVRLGEQRLELMDRSLPDGHPVLLAETAYYLAVVEQLVDQLSTRVLLEEVLLVCRAYLDKPQHREAFESSHSVVLALFASLGRQQQGGAVTVHESDREEVVRSIAPFYASSLISCSADGMLNTTQLRLAFSSLVAGASASSLSAESNDRDTKGAALVWYCIECLLSEITTHHTPSKAGETPSSEEQYGRLTLTLVSLIAAIPPSPSLAPLLPRLLENVEVLVKREEDLQRREMVLKAIYEEIIRSVGDEAREVSLRWWFDAFTPGAQGAELPMGNKLGGLRSQL